MGLIYRLFSVALFAMLVSTSISAQELNVGLYNYLTFGKSNDLGLDMRYAKNLERNALVFGLELRSIDWGNHLGLLVGYKAGYYQNESFTVGGVTTIHPGLALFQQGSLGSFGFAYAPYLRWQSKKRSFLQLDLGFRYNVCPGYREYGNYQQIEFPVGVKWGISLGDRAE